LSSEDDSFTRQLAKTLNANSFLRENKIKEFEILPFCDGGLNSYQESILLKEAVLEYQPDMLVLQFTDNDSGPARSDFLDTGFLYIASATDVVFAAQRPLPALPLLGKKINIFLFNHSAFARFISYKFYLVRTSSLAAAVRGGKTGEQVSLDAIREMSQITKNKRIPFLLFVFTPPSDKVNHCFDLTDQKRPNQWHIKVRSLSRNLGIDYMNMCDYTKDINSLKSPLEPDCYGCHYSAQGHKIITDVLTEKILSLVKAAE